MASIYLGQTMFEDTFYRWNVASREDVHLVTLACTGAGKSTTAIWPSLCTYPGSMLVVSPKPEHAQKTFWRRQSRRDGPTTTRFHIPGGTADILDPFGEASPLPSVRCNPLAGINVDDERVREMLSAVSDGCVLQEDPRHQHFVDLSAQAIEGAAALLLSTRHPDLCTLPHLSDLLIGLNLETGEVNRDEFEKLLTEMRWNNAAGGIAQRAAAALGEMGPNERGSVLSTLNRSLKWTTDPAMRRHLSGSESCLPKLTSTEPSAPATIYVVLPVTMMGAQARWMRTIVNVTIGHLQRMIRLPHHPVVLALDEFGLLGPNLRTVQQGYLTLRAKKTRIWSLAQSLSQLKSGLGADWESLISSSTVQLFGVHDLGTAQWAAQMLGKALYRRKERRAVFAHRIAQDQNRELVTPEEIMEELGKCRPVQFVFPTTGLPMRLHRLAYRTLVIEGNRFRGLPLEGHYEE